MVWIHGGAFYTGSSTTKQYGPDYLMTDDVILVTLNYRLTVFGFLNFKDPALNIPGNAGLKDQWMALKWVKENIESFGGDSNNITLFGHSAGGVSVGHHLLSEKSKGLVNRAIVMAGTALNPFSVCPPNDMSERIAKKLGWNGEGGEAAALEVLMQAAPEDLIKNSLAGVLFNKQDMENDTFFSFGPILEPYVTETAFLTKDPLELSKNAWSKDIEVLYWYTSNEMIMQCKRRIPPGVTKGPDPATILPYLTRRSKSDEQIVEDEKKIRALYNNFEGVTPDNIQRYINVSLINSVDFSNINQKFLLQFLNDHWVLNGIHRSVLARLNYAKANTYIARFNIVSKLNHHKKIYGGDNLEGASHGDELSYIFCDEFDPIPVSKNSEEWTHIKRMVPLFTGFAKNGGASFKDIQFKPIQKSQLPHNYQGLLIEKDGWKMERLPELERTKVWDTIYPKGTLF